MLCRLCYSADVAQIYKIDNFPKAAQAMPLPDELDDDHPVTLDIRECESCGLIQISNDPVDYFRDVITAATLSDASKKALSEEIREVRAFNPEGRTALEIGSAKGGFLSLLNEQGLQSVGVENNRDSVQASRNLGLDVVEGYLLDGVDLKGQYDFIFCNNFMEHQPDIGAFLKSVKSMLTSDGVVYVSVPNLERILEMDCVYEFVVDHLVYFSKDTLSLAFSMNGMEVLTQYSKNNENDLVVVARRRQVTDLSGSKATIHAIGESIRQRVKTAKSRGDTVAVWGAGHRTLALLAIENIMDVDFVVDGAPFKQGRLTPLTHKTIYPPEKLIEENCDVVIVMLPGAYAPQAVDFLRTNGFDGMCLVFEDKPLRPD